MRVVFSLFIKFGGPLKGGGLALGVRTPCPSKGLYPNIESRWIGGRQPMLDMFQFLLADPVGGWTAD